jgi:hypothetical protein
MSINLSNTAHIKQTLGVWKLFQINCEMEMIIQKIPKFAANGGYHHHWIQLTE